VTGWGNGPHPDRNWTFSTYVRADDLIFASHTGGIADEHGRPLETVPEQTEQAFRNLEKTLRAAGAALDDVVKTTVYLADIADFSEMREAYRKQFSNGYPARMTATTDF
jgi:enamine deaminase RidA (YjgF/YER057c/UK114 family)